MTAIAVRTALGRRLGRDPGSLRFTRDANGKPALAPGEADGIHFSLSTSAGRGLVALSSHGPVGVDLEHVAPLPEFERIASSRFARGETAAIMRLPADLRLRTFYECWTRKEAYLKASGVGLAGGLDSIRVTVAEARPRIISLADGDAARWTLLDVDLGESFTGAVVSRTPPPTEPRAVTPAPLALAPLASECAPLYLHGAAGTFHPERGHGGRLPAHRLHRVLRGPNGAAVCRPRGVPRVLGRGVPRCSGRSSWSGRSPSVRDRRSRYARTIAPSSPAFFPNLRLNYAENLLRPQPGATDEDTAVVAHHAYRPRESLTRGELRDRVRTLAAQLRRIGVAPGDSVVAVAGNNIEVIVGGLAAATVGRDLLHRLAGHGRAGRS